ncbi:MAG TPA: hypothetical protein VFE47_25640 [Tepidisphaeraceae bacterium]|nr:hypothetical protein [Tepidisphaeraceae bacterium]
MPAPTDKPPAHSDSPEPHRAQSDEVLLDAIRMGATLDQAAACAGMSREDVEIYSASDGGYAVQIAQARASGFVDMLRRTREMEQATAVKLLFDNCYAKEMKELQTGSKAMTDVQMQTAIRAVVVKMNEGQLDRVPELLELGRITDDEMKAAELSKTSACQTPESNPSSEILPASAAIARLAAPPADSASLSPSPGK